MNYGFPVTFRPSTLEERALFYHREFPLDGVCTWLNYLRPHKISFTLDLGVETGVVKKYFDSAQDMFIRIGPQKLSNLREITNEYLPEDIYYERNIYRDVFACHECKIREKRGCVGCSKLLGQQLLFDIDPENFNCPNCDVLPNMRMFSFCTRCLNAAKEATLSLNQYLKDVGYRKLKTIFTGRGFHIHVFDKDAFYLTVKDRQQLYLIAKDMGIGLDKGVTLGRIFLARLPHSLNGLVSRIATVIDEKKLEGFDPIADPRSIPEFLSEEMCKIESPKIRI